MWKFKRKYRVKKNAPKLQPKKSDKADLRKWSPFFLNIGLIIMFGITSFIFRDEIIEIYKGGGKTTSTTKVAAPAGGEENKGKYKIRFVDPAQLEGLINAEAATHARWPGYKGKIDDQVAVRKHFAQEFAKWLQENAGQEVDQVYKAHIYYGVTKDGIIVFFGVQNKGGYTTAPAWLIKAVDKSISKGLLVVPGTGLDGENITIIYDVKIKFAPPQ